MKANDPRYHNNTPYNPASMYRNCVNSPLRYEQSIADESGDDNEADADNESADDTEER